MKKKDAKIGLLLPLEKDEGEETEDDMPDARMAAAKAVLAALKSGDAEALDSALSDHYAACNMEE